MQKKMKKTNQQPLVTVLITAYNADRFIGQTLESVISQTYQNLEILVVDDGSTDNTARVVKEFKRIDKRIKLFQLNKNVGPSLASNFGLKKAKAKFIARIDADDIAFPDRIEKQVKFLLENEEVIIVGGQCVLIDEENQIIGQKEYPISHQEIYNSLFIFNPIQHPACMINKSLLPNGKIHYHNGSVLAHDLELLFELAQYGKLANLKEAVLYYRQHQNSLSLKNPKETFKATLSARYKAIKKYGYQPTLKGLAAHFGQAFIVSLLPDEAVYSIFKLLRIRKNLEFNQTLISIKKELAGMIFKWQSNFASVLKSEVI